MSRKKRQSSYLHKQEEWKALYEGGLSFTQIGKIEGVYYKTVQTVLRDVVTPRPKQQFAHLVDKWIELYINKELSINDIAGQFNADVSTVSKYLKQAGIQLRRTGQSSPFESDVPTWIELYQNGKSLKEIADKYNTFPQTVHKHLRDKIKMREYTETSKYYEITNEHYLDKIDSPNKAYWLGIWYGTGFISKSIGGYECTLIVSRKDEITLERFKNHIGYSRGFDLLQEENVDTVKLRINNKSIFDALTSHGLLSNKSTELSFPSFLPPNFLSSFLLGYFEGKGTCYTSCSVISGVTYNKIAFNLFGNERFLSDAREVILQQAGVKLGNGIKNHHKGDREPVFVLRTSAKKTVAQMAEWLYSNDTEYSEIRDIRNLLK